MEKKRCMLEKSVSRYLFIFKLFPFIFRCQFLLFTKYQIINASILLLLYISVMMHFWPPRCVTMMKRVLLYIVPFSLTASLFGCIFVSRSNKNQAVSILEHCGKELKDRGVSVYYREYSLHLIG